MSLVARTVQLSFLADYGAKVAIPPVLHSSADGPLDSARRNASPVYASTVPHQFNAEHAGNRIQRATVFKDRYRARLSP